MPPRSYKRAIDIRRGLSSTDARGTTRVGRRRRRRNTFIIRAANRHSPPYWSNSRRVAFILFCPVPNGCPCWPTVHLPPLQEPIVYGGESLKLGRPTWRRPPSSDLCGGNGHTRRNPVETGRDRSSDYFVGLESKPFGLFGVFGLDRAHRTVRSSGVVCWEARVTYAHIVLYF